MAEHQRFNRRYFLGSLAGLAVALLADSWLFERFFVALRRYDLATPGAANEPVRILQVSDLHIQSVHWGLRRLARQINRLQPDLLLLTGDSIDKQAKMSVLEDWLRLLDPRIPKFAILGNWEYWGKIDLERLREIYTAANCRLLVNESVQVQLKNRRISITGVDSLVGGQPDYALAVQDLAPHDFHLVLSHCPQHRDILAANYAVGPPIDLVLAGHTHGGQINLFGYIPFIPVGSGRYIKGWYRDVEPAMYVSSGVGTSILPLRFMARAEVALFNL